MKPFVESLRYEYPLMADSIVLDLGCHKGTFSKIIADKYDCHILAFEPIKRFYEQAAAALGGRQKTILFNYGIGSSTRWEKFAVKGDMSGAYADGDDVEDVQIVDLDHFIASANPDLAFKEIDLIKLNIEGGEFEVLEHIIKKGLAPMFKNIQVQFHPVVSDYEKRHAAIRESLLKTHRLTYDAPWCWENYERI